MIYVKQSGEQASEQKFDFVQKRKRNNTDCAPLKEKSKNGHFHNKESHARPFSQNGGREGGRRKLKGPSSLLSVQSFPFKVKAARIKGRVSIIDKRRKGTTRSHYRLK
jgi:hypothetical protein